MRLTRGCCHRLVLEPTCHLIGQAHAVSWHKGVRLEPQTHGPAVAVEVWYRAVTGAELMGLAIVSLERETHSIHQNMICN